MNETELYYLLALQKVEGVGDIVAKKLLSKFEVERKYNTIDELVNDESVKEEKDRYPLFHQDENYKFFSVEFFRFELNNIFIAFSFSVSLFGLTLTLTVNALTLIKL